MLSHEYVRSPSRASEVGFMPNDRLLSRGRRRMPGQHQRRPPGPAGGIDTHDLLTLQRTAGNRAVAMVVARTASATGTVQIGKLAIKVIEGNLAKWAAGEVPDWLEVTSEKGSHSATLDRLSRERTKIDSLTLTTAPANKAGQQLDLGALAIEFTNGRVKGYKVDGTTESWRLSDFDGVHRTKTTHKVS